jgi:DNA-binding response OmpR family regulator
MLQAHILVVDNDADTRLIVAEALQSAGYTISQAGDGEQAIELLYQAARTVQPVTVVITDWRLRLVDGIEVLYVARKLEPPAEVIILTGVGTIDTSIAAIRAGAYDYLLKPYELQDLLVCVAEAVQHRQEEQRESDVLRTIARAMRGLDEFSAPVPPALPLHAHEAPPVAAVCSPHTIQVGDLCINTARQSVSFAGRALHLTPMEYAIVCYLAQVQGHVVDYCEIARHTPHGEVEDKTQAQMLLKPHIHKLRRKIARDYFVSIRGVGYMLVAP